MTTRLDTIMAKATAGEYGEESDTIGKLAGLFRSATFDQGWGPFICGAVGDEVGGLHQGYMVCPAYGADAGCTALYMRVERG